MNVKYKCAVMKNLCKITGMTATNSVAPGTGNVSAGTSTFAMIVLEKGLSQVYREIDMVTTPSGFPCAMSHANNGTSDL